MLTATLIIIGLAIAFLLVTALRWVHRKYRVRQMFAMIRREREDNKRAYSRVAETFSTQQNQWKTNLSVLEYLQTHSGVPSEGWPGRIDWTIEVPAFADTQWQAVLRSGATALMQRHQFHEAEELYTDLDRLSTSREALLAAVESARRYAETNPSRSGSNQLADEIALVRAVRTAHGKLGADMRQFNQAHTDFLPCLPVDAAEAADDAQGQP